ncbi:hypothetical protein L596_005812 [Steinernema carpocapsae]|uniref:Uncharacterized protein n=1 Tax=Steinernema carpocapsae TaxID=34508 RepID=A0A4U8V088_STECR|nr:hypothetical protein L596_005812 [Steinernema carpocapsae]
MSVSATERRSLIVSSVCAISHAWVDRTEICILMRCAHIPLSAFLKASSFFVLATAATAGGCTAVSRRRAATATKRTMCSCLLRIKKYSLRRSPSRVLWIHDRSLRTQFLAGQHTLAPSLANAVSLGWVSAFGTKRRAFSMSACAVPIFVLAPSTP